MQSHSGTRKATSGASNGNRNGKSSTLGRLIKFRIVTSTSILEVTTDTTPAFKVILQNTSKARLIDNFEQVARKHILQAPRSFSICLRIVLGSTYTQQHSFRRMRERELHQYFASCSGIVDANITVDRGHKWILRFPVSSSGLGNAIFQLPTTDEVLEKSNKKTDHNSRVERLESRARKVVVLQLGSAAKRKQRYDSARIVNIVFHPASHIAAGWTTVDIRLLAHADYDAIEDAITAIIDQKLRQAGFDYLVPLRRWNCRIGNEVSREPIQKHKLLHEYFRGLNTAMMIIVNVGFKYEHPLDETTSTIPSRYDVIRWAQKLGQAGVMPPVRNSGSYRENSKCPSGSVEGDGNDCVRDGTREDLERDREKTFGTAAMRAGKEMREERERLEDKEAIACAELIGEYLQILGV